MVHLWYLGAIRALLILYVCGLLLTRESGSPLQRRAAEALSFEISKLGCWRRRVVHRNGGNSIHIATGNCLPLSQPLQKVQVRMRVRAQSANYGHPMISFTLSTEHVRDTVITDEGGQVIYTTDTPFNFGSRTTTIRKANPNNRMLNQFDVMGEIEWHTWSSSKFRFGGTEVETAYFIESRGFTGRKRVFTGPDGRPYRWDLHHRVVVLSRDDRSRTEVARYHRATLGIIGRKRKATLEVSPEVVHMMDTVIMTFIYVEKLRMDKERSSRRAHAGGSAAPGAFGTAF